MMWVKSPLLRRLSALSLFVLFITLPIALGERLLIEPFRARVRDIASLSEQLANLRSAEVGQKFVSNFDIQAKRRMKSLQIFWFGRTRPQIAAAMQDVLRGAAQQSEGRVVSISVMEEGQKDSSLSIRARIEGDLTTLQHVLAVAETARPRLFITSLVVTVASAANTPAQPQLLSFEVGAAGYLSADDHATP